MSNSNYTQNDKNSTNTIDNAHSLALLLLVIVIITSSQHLFSKVHVFASPEYPTAIMAVIAGSIVALLSYLPIKYLYSGATGLSNNQLISMSVLLGIITAYFMVFEIRPGLPSISALTLMIYLFYHHIDQIPLSHTR